MTRRPPRLQRFLLLACLFLVLPAGFPVHAQAPPDLQSPQALRPGGAALSLQAPRPLPPPAPYPDPMSPWEAVARGAATIVEDPPSFGQPLLYPVKSASNAVFIHLDNATDVRLILEREDFIHLGHPDAQDGILFPPPRQARTHGFWKSWDNHAAPEFMERWLRWVNEDSILFGPGEMYGEVDLDNVVEMMTTPPRPSATDHLRVQLLATWLSIQAELLPLNAWIEPSGVQGVAGLLGDGPIALHVDPVDNGVYSIQRGGVIGTIETLVDGGVMVHQEVEALKDLLDAINNGNTHVLTQGSVIQPRQIWETIIAQNQDRSLYGRMEGDPDYRQPPGLASVWPCTEGLGLSQIVATAQFGLGGEIMPDPIKEIARPLRFGLVTSARVGGDPWEGTDVVTLMVGGKTFTKTVQYDLSQTADEQLRAFLAELGRGTGLEVHTQTYHPPGSPYSFLYAVVRSRWHWKLENVETAGRYPWFRSRVPDVSPDAYATYGIQLQNLIWLHLEVNPAVVVGKTPLYGTLPQSVQVRVTNLGRQPSGSILVRDTVPRGLVASNFSIPPENVAGGPGGAQVLTWHLPPLDGSEALGIHPEHTITYEMDGTVTRRTLVPGATALWNGQTSYSAPAILAPW